MVGSYVSAAMCVCMCAFVCANHCYRCGFSQQRQQLCAVISVSLFTFCNFYSFSYMYSLRFVSMLCAHAAVLALRFCLLTFTSLIRFCRVASA